MLPVRQSRNKNNRCVWCKSLFFLNRKMIVLIIISQMYVDCTSAHTELLITTTNHHLRSDGTTECNWHGHDIFGECAVAVVCFCVCLWFAVLPGLSRIYVVWQLYVAVDWFWTLPGHSTSYLENWCAFLPADVALCVCGRWWQKTERQVRSRR